MITTVASEKSNNCLEGCRLPATDNLIYFQGVNSYRLEGTEMVRKDRKEYKHNYNVTHREETNQRNAIKNPHKNKLVQHHTKYKEIHGVDEIVMMTASEHLKLHKKLRREGKCNIPVSKLEHISEIAHQRTQLYKENQRKRDKKRWDTNYYCCFATNYKVAPYISLIIEIVTNTVKGTIWIKSRFRSCKDQLYIIDEAT